MGLKHPRTWLRWLVVGLGLLAGLVLGPAPGRAAALPPLTPQVLVVFAKSVTIRLPLDDLGPVERVEVYLRPEGMVDTYTQDMHLNGPLAEVTLSMHDYPLPPFIQVYYWFRIYPAAGEPVQSPAFVFIYEDNRFTWQERAVDPVQVYWSEGGAKVAEAALNAAHIALQNAFVQWQGHFDTTRGPLRIYVYPSRAALAEALAPLPDAWRTPEAQARLHIILAGGNPSPAGLLELQRAVAYATAQRVLYDTVQEGYANLPWWLREGLALLAEPQGVDATAYQALTEAARANQLIPLRALCAAPPDDLDDPRLAQAEAGAFVAHVFGRYGPAGLRRLLDIYAGGLGCEDGFQAALGLSLQAMEDDWRSAAGLHPQEGLTPGWVGVGVAVSMLGPFVALAVVYARRRTADDDTLP